MSKNLLSAVPSVSWLWWWWFSHWVVSDSYNPLDYSPPGSSARGISQARIMEWLPFPSPGNLPDPGIEPRFPALQENSLPTELPRKPVNSTTLTKTPASQDSSHRVLIGGYSECIYWAPTRCQALSQAQKYEGEHTELPELPFKGHHNTGW